MKLLKEWKIIDYAIIFYLAKKFITPFKKWKAFNLGLIDEKGRRTKKEVRTPEEKNAYSPLDRMIRKIRVFVGDRWFLKLTLAYLLFKKDDINYFPLSNAILLEDFNNSIIKYIDNDPLEKINLIYEKKEKLFTFKLFSTFKIDNTESITSDFGGDILDINDNFLDELNDCFSYLKSGGYKKFKIFLDNLNKYDIIEVNYSKTELKIESMNLGMFYTVFKTEEKADEFIKMWKEFMTEIKNGYNK